MEPAELVKIIFSKVQDVDPDNVCKIVGCILLREPDEKEMVHLAYGTESSLHDTIYQAKDTLTAIYARCSAPSPVAGYHHQQAWSRPAAVRHFSPAAAAYSAVQYSWDSPPHAASEKEYAFVGDHLDGGGGYYFPPDAFRNGAAGPRERRGSNGVPSRRPSCHYFFKGAGACKNGLNCLYSHHQAYSPDGIHGGTTPGSLERLEVEITELLHSRRGQPVSIASLPTLYGEKYGKGLQADGYLTESRRHGKAGYSLTKLLSRFDKIRVIERPHGQHSVVLAEDAAKYGDSPASSHQIYLTFPSDSNFTEDDVANYFGQYGAVRDVRIPCQDQRMFGFVSFQSPETVTALLMRRNPHFICGSRVLAKAYRERTRCISERTNTKPTTTTMHYYPPRWIDTGPEFYPADYDSPRLELERRRFAGLRVEPQCAYFDCNIGDVGPFSSPSTGSKEPGRMDPPATPDPLDDIVSTSQAPPIQATSSYQDQDSNQIELLPESPFASSAPAGNGV